MLRTRNQLFLLFFFILFQAKSQNLVPNPSFENATNIPCTSIGSGSLFTFNNSMQDWQIPSIGTTDIYSTLSPTICFSNPIISSQFSFGIQIPRTGNNMCGIITYGGPLNYREYLEVKLITPLIVGKRYYTEMYVSAGDATKYGSNNLGMYFSDNLISAPNLLQNLPYTPQIKNNAPIIDTINWVKISGTFVATSRAQYLTIGNFNEDLTTTVVIKSNNPRAFQAYYFIDDVFVKLTCNPKDSSSIICEGASISLNLNDPNIIGWSLANSPNTIISNTSTLLVSPLATTSYIAHYDCDETSIFEVIVAPIPTFNLGTDTTICIGQTMSFDATTTNASYLWQDGSTVPNYVVRKTGKYAVTITNGCKKIHDDVFINVVNPSTFSFGSDTTICKDEIIHFDATADGGTYLWQDGSTNALYTVKDPGYYSVAIQNICGTSTDNITLNLCCAGATIPNLITPNGDDKNEVFYIDCYGNGDYELVIYNTWGALVYQNKAYLNNWGAANVSDGIYYYVIKYKNQSINNGWVQVLR